MSHSSDSTLSTVANWISIVTFVTTTLGSLTILYTFYKQLEKVEEDLIAYGNVLAESSKVLVADIDAIEPIVQRSHAKVAPLDSTIELYHNIRQLTDKLERILKAKAPDKKGLARFIRLYKLGKNTDLTHTAREIQRVTNSLSITKMNLIFW